MKMINFFNTILQNWSKAPGEHIGPGEIDYSVLLNGNYLCLYPEQCCSVWSEQLL